MKNIVQFHIYNLYKFSHCKNTLDEAFEKSKKTFFSHFNNVIIVFIVLPLWFSIDFTGLLKKYVGNSVIETKPFIIILIIFIIILNESKYNPTKKLLDNYYSRELVDKSNDKFAGTSKFITYPYRLVFIFGNDFLVLCMIFVWLKIFHLLGIKVTLIH